MKYLLLIFCLLFNLSAQVHSLYSNVNRENGRPLINYYGPEDYNSEPQNLTILRDSKGIIYVGNNSGTVLEFDGVTWRHIILPNNLAVECLEDDKQGHIYVGGTKDFGVLKPDSNGNLFFQSLLEHVEIQDKMFTWVTPINVTPEGIYFLSSQRLFRWKNNKLKAWKPYKAFRNSFYIYDNFYVNEEKNGLMLMKNDTLVRMPGWEKLPADELVAMFPYTGLTETKINTDKKSLLLCYSKKGMFIYNGNTLRPFNGPANEYIKKYGARCGSLLNDSTFAIGTFQNGVIVFNKNGETIQKINDSPGFRDNIVYCMIPDRENGIWMAMQQGIAHVISINSELSIFDHSSGLNGVVLALPAPLRHNGILYVCTTNGVYYLDKMQSRFLMIPGLTGDFWSLFEFNKSLFAVRQSIRKINNNTSILIKRLKQQALTVHQSAVNPGTVYIGIKEGGLKILKMNNGKWIESKRIEGIYEIVRNMVEERNGDLWLGKDTDGLIHVHFSSEKKILEIKRYSTQQGLPPGRIYAYKTSLYPVFSTNRGLFRFSKLSDRFIPDSTFGITIADGSRGTGFLTEDNKRNIWISVYKGTSYYLSVSRYSSNGNYSSERTPYKGMLSTGMWTIFPEDSGIIWFGGENGLVRYNDNFSKNEAAEFPALVRLVTINGDSVIYGGNIPENGGKNSYDLNYTENTLSFDYSAVYYNYSEQNLYKVFLEGFDKDWSNWVPLTTKNYTNLPDGSYIFHVVARNIYGDESKEDRFAFFILPPWYFKWWAFLLYGFVFIGLFILIVVSYNKYHIKLLRQRNTELEKIVFERTAELAEKNSGLQELSTMKSRFFANISHEFRTPLTLILGQIESLLPDLKKEHNISRARMALRNGKQLHQLINQLLDLSRFDAHRMKLRASEQNIVKLLRYLTASFESLAEQKGITLKFDAPIENIPVYFEQDKIEKIMHNLLFNALKFTPDEGQVTVCVNMELRISKNNFSDTLGHEIVGDAKIVIQDSGIGIPKERLPHIFNRFFQVDNSTTREYDGTGIGLALTKELVQIHGGGISVESEEGSGTTFIIILPTGKAHLKPDQIVGTDSIKEISYSAFNKFEIEPDLYGNPELEEHNQKLINNNKSGNILVIEDNPDMRTYIIETLIKGHNIMEASNGGEGLQTAIEEIPDLIITDIMMPIMDGYELTRRLRKNRFTDHIPIIMLTAKAEESDRFEGLERGADAFLVKPFSTKELEIRVRKLIEIREKMKKQIGEKAVLTPAELSVPSMDQQFLILMQNLIEKNLGDENFGVDALAEEIGMNKRQLERKLKALTDCTPQKCIRVMRLNRAKQLLEQDAGNITEIAFSVGYSSVNAFSRAFKEEFKILPSSIISHKN